MHPQTVFPRKEVRHTGRLERPLPVLHKDNKLAKTNINTHKRWRWGQKKGGRKQKSWPKNSLHPPRGRGRNVKEESVLFFRFHTADTNRLPFNAVIFSEHGSRLRPFWEDQQNSVRTSFMSNQPLEPGPHVLWSRERQVPPQQKRLTLARRVQRQSDPPSTTLSRQFHQHLHLIN